MDISDETHSLRDIPSHHVVSPRAPRELREVVTLFINLIGLEDDFANKRLDVVQSVMAAIIASCKMFGGAIRQFVVDGALALPRPRL